MKLNEGYQLTEDKPEDNSSESAQFTMDRIQCVRLSVQPSRGLIDEKFIVLIQNAPPRFKLTIHAFHQCEQGNKFEAYGHYISDNTGTVNVSEDVSLGGTYYGIEPMGLLLSLTPVPGSTLGIRMRKMNVQTPMEVTISVYQGHQTEGFVDQLPLASVLVERWSMAPGVRRFPITEGGLSGTLFLPPGPGPFPGILDLWGFTGGVLMENRSSMLASHGFASLTLNCMPPKLHLESKKIVDIDFDHFETAYRFLQQHPQVNSSRISMLGNCLGCSVVMRLALYSQLENLRCVVCISGIHTQKVGLSFDAMLKDMARLSMKAIFNEDNHLIMRHTLPPLTQENKVDVGRLQCPMLLVVGEDNQFFACDVVAMDMKEVMEQAGNSHLLNVLTYPNTGHLIDIPYLAHSRVIPFLLFGKQSEDFALMGGEMVAHCKAQEDAWSKTLDFLRKNLYGDTEPGAALVSRL